MRPPYLALLLLSLGCASQPPRRIPFERAMQQEPGPSTPDATATAFERQLPRFLETARRVRLASPVGSAMPASQLNAWTKLLDSVDTELEGPHQALGLIRARLRVESEFHTDVQLFGDVPVSLAERVPLALRRLSTRIRTLTVRVRRADPSRFLWPVAPVVVSSPYGVRVHPIAGEHRFHAGIDLEVPVAHPVVAVEAGTVVFAAWNGAHGKQIELQHDVHWATRYSHLDTLLVPSGTVVKKGQVIGLSGQTGMATGPHLHFELRRDGDALDPETFLRAPRPVLYSERGP